MGCFPFTNYHFQTGVTVMGFAEDFGLSLMPWLDLWSEYPQSRLPRYGLPRSRYPRSGYPRSCYPLSIASSLSLEPWPQALASMVWISQPSVWFPCSGTCVRPGLSTPAILSYV